MKKVKLNKYILFVLFSFMSFLGVASAAGNALSSGDSMFIPKTSYPGLTCVAVGEDNPFALTETSSGYKVTNPEGTLPGVEGKIDCSYSGNDGSEISLPFNMVSTATGTGNFGLTADNPETDILTFIGQGEIVDISSSNEYVIIDRDNCNSTSCPIRINPDVFDLANDGRRINTTVTVKYTINGNEYTKDFNVNVDKFYGAKAYPGGVGTCGFPGDEWVFRTASLSSGSNNFGYYEGVPNAKLPDCTPTNPVVEIEFKGWSSGLTNDSRPKAIGGCTGVVPAGTSVSSGNYAACYEQKPTLQLAIAEGNIENPGDWKYSDGRGYYYVGSSTTTVTLPNAVFVGFDTDKELNTWKCVDKDGNESDKNPGDSVALDGGKCTAIIDTTHVTERDYNKRIYVKQTTTFNVSGMESCPSYSDSFISFGEEDGVCKVTGISATPDDSTVDVPVQVNGRTVTFKYRVISLSGSSQNGDEDFIIDTTVNENMDASLTYQDENGVITNVPDSFIIKLNAPHHKINDSIGGASIYEAWWPETDGGADVAHSALCLDPGRAGPGSTGASYIRLKQEEMPADLRKFASYIGDVIIPMAGEDAFSGRDNNWRIATQVAVRLVAAVDDVMSGRGAGSLATHYDTYKAGANAIKPIEGKDAATVKSIVQSELGITEDDLLNKIAQIITEYKSHPDPVEMGNDITRTIEGRESQVYGSDGYEINYKGTISLPAGVTSIPTLGTSNCNSNTGTTGVQCVVNGSLTRNDAESNSQGKEVYNYDITIRVPDASKVVPPKTNEEKIKMSFKLEFTGASHVKGVWFAQPDNGAYLQRMIVFDYSHNSGDTYVYFPVVPETCLEIPSLDPNRCLDEDNCNINKQLFKDSGCCADLNDEVTYGYLMQTVCIGNCTTSSFESVCKYDIDPAHEDRAELYQIKEGTVYSGGSYSNNIGSCIVNVSDNYANSSASFSRTDDNGNNINVAHYNGNTYCAVTCKEDWTITMDSFGNYVGNRAHAAGTWFAIEDDIFIGGSRTCFTSFIDYDKYMNDLTQQSETAIKNYNNYNYYSRQYTDIKRQADGDSNKNLADAIASTGTKCVKYKKCENSAGKPDYASDDDIFFDDADDSKQCYAVSEAGSSGSGGSGTPTCEHGTWDEDENQCREYFDLDCDTYGQSMKHTLSTNNDVFGAEFNNDDYLYDWTHGDPENKKFGSGSYMTQTTSKAKAFGNYSRSDYIECTIEENKEPDGIATLTCKYGTNGTFPVSDSGIAGDLSASEDDMKLFCNDKVNTVTNDDGDSETFCKCNSTDASSSSCNLDESALTNEDDVFEHLSLKVLDHAEGKAEEYQSGLTNAVNTVYELSANMYDCQHFSLYNTSDDGRTYDSIDADGNKTTLNYATTKVPTNRTVLGENRNYVKINTAFKPVGSYSYDEEAFMTILKDDNILVEDMIRNDEVLGESFVGATDKQVDAQIKAYDKYGNLYEYPDVKLSRNYINTKYYNPDSAWTESATLDAWKNYEDSTEVEKKATDSIDDLERRKVITLCTIGEHDGLEASNRGGKSGMTIGGTSSNNGYELSSVVQPVTSDGVTWEGGSCYQVNVAYVNTHYIKSEISNSSFYKNKGNWWQRGNDIKEHGDDLREAIENANARPGNNYNVSQEEGSGLWSIMGEKNVFPISLDTPRNLYQYRYSFKDIGSYSDGKLGRIMGDTNSIIRLNTRACFYEVFEEVCLCCGSEIRTYVEGSDDKTKDYINENGHPYHQIDDPTKVTDNKDGILNIASSTFSLNDVASKYGSSSRETPVNWSDSSPFFYDGVTHMTNKGDVALDAIEAKGENAYSETPEYSYYLTPASLSAIRDYNASNGYDVDFNKLKVYGRYSIAPLTSCSSPTSCDWGSSASEFKMNNKIVNFRHYGSEFLEEFMYDLNAVYDGTLAKSGNDQVCEIYVTAGTDGKTISNDITNKVKSGCRWIDYISESNGEYFRLAFK